MRRAVVHALRQVARVAAFAGLTGVATGGRAPQSAPPKAHEQQEAGLAAQLAERLAAIRAEHDVPALGAARVGRGGQLVQAVAGVRRLGEPGAATLEDRWHLGSCGKAMTATLVAKLVEEGTLRFDATLAELFPERAEAMAAGWRGATVRQLLDHRAGLPENVRTHTAATARIDPESPPRAQRLALLEAALAEPPATPPGSARAYSNTGYWIAGAIVERVTGEPFERALHERLFAPLCMAGAGVGAPGADDRERANAWGHSVVPRVGLRMALDPAGAAARQPAWYAPAGDVHATLADWARFVALHAGLAAAPAAGDAAQDAVRAPAPYLTAATLAAMHTPVADDYACGFAVARDADGALRLAHGGESAGWSAWCILEPARARAAIAACNQGGDAARAACRAAVDAALALAGE